MKFKDIKHNKNIYLYHGDIVSVNTFLKTKKKFVGLSLRKGDKNHIKHDLTKKLDLLDNSVDIIQSEDVMEHIELSNLKDVINEMYRVLKNNGLFRFSIPDYNCDFLYNRTEKNEKGELIFDSGGGGSYDRVNKKVINGGHVWFPTYVSVKKLLETTNFKSENINYLHYYDENKKPIVKDIDYSLGYIFRTPDNDKRVQNPRRPMSIVVDCYK